MDETQSRMARAALRWSLDDLAKASGVARRTVVNFENGINVLPENAARLRSTMESEGVIFIGSGAHAGGVVPPVEGR
jgi:transcriptional regulator with XRE-family HTH domain